MRLAFAAVQTTRLTIPADGGHLSSWGDAIVLRDIPCGDLILDLSALESVDPLLLIRLRGFVDWHCGAGYKIEIVGPRNRIVRTYLKLMLLAADLPDGCVCDLAPSVTEGLSKVLIPIRRLHSPADAVKLDQELEALYLAHFQGKIAPLASAFTRAIGEISDNATTHGASVGGCAYVAAQRYGDTRCVFAIGDLGIGVPAHIRRARPEFKDDEIAIREATKEGVSGTGDAMRGFGFQEVIDALKETAVADGELRVWSGHGRFRVAAGGGLQHRRRAWMVEKPTIGTWVRVELAS